MMKNMPMGIQRLHHDTTSINVTGDYDNESRTRLIEIVRGHRKDHRDDLKQFVISLVTNQHGIPMFMEPFSGNTIGQKEFPQIDSGSEREPGHGSEDLPHGRFSVLYRR
jgi:transposase